MNASPNNALQRTRAAVSLQSIPGELSTSERRRAPLSLGPLGARGEPWNRPPWRILLGLFALLLETSLAVAQSSDCTRISRTYSWGNGFESASLTFDSSCRVKIATWSDDGRGWTGACQAAVAQDRVTLSPIPPLAKGALPLELRLIPWDERTYLIPEDRLREFCNVVNSGLEPSRQRWFLLAGEEPSGLPAGLPSVPAAFTPFLLSRPLAGRVLAIERPETFRTIVVNDCEQKERVQTELVRVSVGSSDGLLPGMVIFGHNPLRPNFFAEMTVQSVEVGSSLAEVTFHVARVRKGDTVSTRRARPRQ